MKKRLLALFLCMLIALTSFTACGGSDSGKEDSEETETGIGEEETEEEIGFSYFEVAGMDFSFSSGVGGWGTGITVEADGTFEGEYYSGVFDLTAEEKELYPNAYVMRGVSEFRGQFGELEKVNDYTFRTTVKKLEYVKEVGTYEDMGDEIYEYCEAYGLKEGDDICFFTPDAPKAELSEEFLLWVYIANSDDPNLTVYCIYNVTDQYGFEGEERGEGGILQ